MRWRRGLIPILALFAAVVVVSDLFRTLDSVYGDPKGFAFGKLSIAEQLVDPNVLDISTGVAADFSRYAELHIGLDLLFMAVYGTLAVLLIRVRMPSRFASDAAIHRRRVRLTVFVLVLIVVDLVEDALMWGTGGFAAGKIPDGYGLVLGLVTVAKWLLVAYVFGSTVPWCRMWRWIRRRVIRRVA